MSLYSLLVLIDECGRPFATCLCRGHARADVSLGLQKKDVLFWSLLRRGLIATGQVMVGSRYRDPRTVPVLLLCCSERPEGPSHDVVGMPTPNDDDRITGFIERVAPKLTPPLLSPDTSSFQQKHKQYRVQYCV